MLAIPVPMSTHMLALLALLALLLATASGSSEITGGQPATNDWVGVDPALEALAAALPAGGGPVAREEQAAALSFAEF